MGHTNHTERVPCRTVPYLHRVFLEGPPVVLAQRRGATELTGVVPPEGEKALRREHQGVLGSASDRHRVQALQKTTGREFGEDKDRVDEKSERRDGVQIRKSSQETTEKRREAGGAEG